MRFNTKEFITSNLDLVKKYLESDTYHIKVDDYTPAKRELLRGESNLIKRGVSFELSTLHKLEIIKCSEDIIYFSKKYIKIISTDHGVIGFDMWPYQESLLKKYKSNRFVLSMQSRQSGKTTVTAAFLLHFATFNSSKTIAIVAHKKSQAVEVLQRIQLSYECLPFFLKQGLISYNKGSTKFENNSEIFCSASQSGSLRGKSCVSKDTYITVRNKSSNQIETITMGEFESFLIPTQSKQVLKNTEYEVLTPDGWSDFDGLVITPNRELIKLDAYNLECTPCHKILVDDVFVECGDLPHSEIKGLHSVYDLLNVEKQNRYYTNELVSHNCSLVYIDEAAFIPHDMEFYESTYPVIASGSNSKVIMTTTPNGAKGMFYKLWMDSLANKNSYVNIKVPWNKVPTRDKKWKIESIKQTSQEQFDQEHELEFRGSKHAFLSYSEAQSQVIKQCKKLDNAHFIEEPNPNSKYVMTVDTSRGLGNDYCALVVVDVTQLPYRVAAKYRDNKIDPLSFPMVCVAIAKQYNNALMLVELNDLGEQTANIIFHDFCYDNLLSTIKKDGKQIIGHGRDQQLGVKTSQTVRSSGCGTLKTLISNGNLSLQDQDIVDEFGNFILKGKRYEAAEGCHDDLVMCLVLFAWAINQEYVSALLESNNRDLLMKQHVKLAEEALTPFGFISNGIDDIF